MYSALIYPCITVGFELVTEKPSHQLPGKLQTLSLSKSSSCSIAMRRSDYIGWVESKLPLREVRIQHAELTQSADKVSAAEILENIPMLQFNPPSDDPGLERR